MVWTAALLVADRPGQHDGARRPRYDDPLRAERRV